MGAYAIGVLLAVIMAETDYRKFKTTVAAKINKFRIPIFVITGAAMLWTVFATYPLFHSGF